MKNLFTRLRSWYTANLKYEGLSSGCRQCSTMLHRGRMTSAIVTWLSSTKKLVRHAHDREYAAITDSAIDRGHLMAANRRRKRAERKLKWYVKTLRKESAERLGFELQCDEYESVLLDANLAMADISSCPILPDTKAMAEAQQRFKAYMKVHYAEIAKRQLNRELKKSAFGCLFFGDANGDPKDVYSGIFGGEDFSSTENKETKQQ